MGEVVPNHTSTSHDFRVRGLTDDSRDLDDIPVFIHFPNSKLQINTQKRQFLSIFFIYLATMFETFASHSIYYTYIPHLVAKPDDVDDINLLLYLIAYVIAFITGFFTDKYLHRYWLITLGYFIYLIGYVMLYISLHDSICHMDYTNSGPLHHCGALNLGTRIEGTGCSCLLLFSLLFIGVGIGLAWGHMAIFGADQIQHPIHIAVYFHGYYFSYQAGVAITLYAVSEKTSSNNELLVLVGLGGCALSFVMFLAGTPFYLPEFTQHLKDPFIHLLKQISCSRKLDPSQRIVIDDDEPPGQIVVDLGALMLVGQLDREYLDGVKRFLRLLLIFMLLVPFETAFNVQEYLFQLQAAEMKYAPWNMIDEHKIRYPLKWFTYGFNLLTLLLFIPVFVFFWYVFSKRGNQRLSFTFTRDAIHYRLIAGLLFAALSMIVAGVVSSVQLNRHQKCLDEHPTNSEECYEVYRYGATTYDVSGVRIGWTTPQNVLSAFSEILVEITVLQLTYLDAPQTQQYRMHGKFVSLTYLSGMLGSGLGSLLLQAGTSFYCESVTPDGCILIHNNFIWFLYILGAFQFLAAFLVLGAVLDYFRWSETGKSILC